MDILITCMVCFLLIGSLVYFIVAEKSKKKRKSLNVLEVHFSNGTAFVGWIICFIFNTLFTLGYYLKFFSNEFTLRNYLLTAILFLPLLIICYYLERWRVVIDEGRIVKYGFISKRTFIISDITEIKQTWFGNKYYVGNKKIFSINARYHDYSRAFENHIREQAGLNQN